MTCLGRDCDEPAVYIIGRRMRRHLCAKCAVVHVKKWLDAWGYGGMGRVTIYNTEGKNLMTISEKPKWSLAACK